MKLLCKRNVFPKRVGLGRLFREALGSRSEKNTKNGMAQLGEMGAVITNTETVLFDLAGIAGTDEFKTLQKLII